MVQRVWALARSVDGVARVVVATDDERIAKFCEMIGADCCMTSREARSGTDRTYEAVTQLNPLPTIILNLQGDAILTPPWVIADLLRFATSRTDVKISTVATRMTIDAFRQLQLVKSGGEVGGTTVTFDREGRALYFSKSPIPFVRTVATPLPVFRHIGLYSFTFEALQTFVGLPESQLEKAEGLEQLRALEGGIPIHVVEVDYRERTHWGVDSPQDAALCATIIAKEGELLSSYDGKGHCLVQSPC